MCAAGVAGGHTGDVKNQQTTRQSEYEYMSFQFVIYQKTAGIVPTKAGQYRQYNAERITGSLDCCLTGFFCTDAIYVFYVENEYLSIANASCLGFVDDRIDNFLHIGILDDDLNFNL